MNKLIDVAKKHNIELETISNGSLFSVPRYASLVLKFDVITISFDSTDKEMFEFLRPGSYFEKTIENIKILTDSKKTQHVSTDIGISFVATHLNYKQIPGLAKIALITGVNRVGVVEVENWYVRGQDRFQESEDFVSKTREISRNIEELTSKLKNELEKKNIRVTYQSAKKRKETCRWPFDSAFITVDGFVMSCCIRMDKDVFNFGNVFEEDFSSIWNNEKYQKFRDSMINGTLNPICDECPGLKR